MNSVVFSAFILLFCTRVITSQTFSDLIEEEYQTWEIISKTEVRKLNTKNISFEPDKSYILLKTTPMKSKDYSNSEIYKFIQKNIEMVPVTLNTTSESSGYQRLIYSWLGKYSSLQQKLYTARIVAIVWDIIRKKNDRILHIGREVQDDESKQFLNHFSNWFISNPNIKKLVKFADLYEIKLVNHQIEANLIPVNEKLLNDSNRYVLHTEKSIYVYKSSGNTQINNVTDRLANTIQNDRSAIIENLKIKYVDISKFQNKVKKVSAMFINAGTTMEHVFTKINVALFGKLEILTVKSADNNSNFVYRYSTKHSLELKKFAGFQNCHIVKNRLVNSVFLILGEQCTVRDAQYVLQQGEIYYNKPTKKVMIVMPHKPPTSFLANFDLFKAYLLQIY